MSSRPLLSVLILGLGCACRVGPDYAPPEVEVAERFGEGRDDLADAPVDAWWEGFDDPLLQALVEEAFAANHDVRASLERVRVARALRRVESSGYWPQVGVGAGYTWDRISEGNPRFGPAVEAGLFPRDIEYWDVGFDVAWELDVFGGTARGVEAATAELQAEELERGALMLSVAAEVAREYVELRANRERLRLFEGRVEDERARNAVLARQRDGGYVPATTVMRGRAAVLDLESRVPTLEAEVRAGEFRLAVLLGRRPDEGVPELADAGALPAAPAGVPLGLPSDLLRRRPDVLAAERRLAAATAQVGVATADYYPKFWLTGSPYLEARDFEDLFQSSSTGWKFGPAVEWNLFSAGRVDARVDAAEARRAEAGIAYEATVRRAFEEVESSLVRYGKATESLAHQGEAVALLRRNEAVQARRRDAGIATELERLDSRIDAAVARLALVDREELVWTQRVALHKALGGGWPSAERVAREAAARDTQVEGGDS